MDIYVYETVKRRVTYIEQTNLTKIGSCRNENKSTYVPFESNIPHTNEIDLERLKLQRHLIIRILV